MGSGVETGRITTDIPARMDRLPWSRWHWLVVIGPRHGVDPRRARGHHRGLDVRCAVRSQDRAGTRQLRRRPRGRRLRHRRVPRRAVLRSAHRPVRSQEAVPADACGLHRGHRADGVLDEPDLVLRLPVPHRRRHRWRVRRHQLRHRRADPQEVPGTRRRRHQRLVLGRCRGRCAADHPAARPDPGQPGVGLAGRLRARRDPGRRHPDRASQRPREPPLAVHPRPRGRGRADRP